MKSTLTSIGPQMLHTRKRPTCRRERHRYGSNGSNQEFDKGLVQNMAIVGSFANKQNEILFILIIGMNYIEY